MLQVKNIRKSYTTGSFTQKALDDVSITLRDNEFVAILGPSGSGKTTLLNIIGGLDHYDSGDLVIDGISTKQYKDRDWDTYRNNRIGFVFQSYNLIPHQTILSNVELALTLSGVSKEERRKRAKEALEQVGLGDHINKKPSQLSGGQMQRVAIARALINNPEILLADEPTGALDSKTSVQIMDLLTEIASDRLVVMVTHNPDLAEQYATRIVNLSDGVITSDSDPYVPTEEDLARVSTKKPRRTSMGMLTALSLSFNNLMTKKGRTLMTAIAGSIGIIGIAAILALANGVNQYIADVEEETLSEYPLQITSSAFDMTSLLTSSSDDEDSSESSEESASNIMKNMTERGSEDEVTVVKSLTSMFESIGTNDLESLKTYLDSGESGVGPYVNAIEYSYNVDPQIYLADTSTKIHQVNPDTTFSSMGLSSSSYSNSLLSSSMSTNTFYQMPSDTSLYEDQYDVVAGHWPENYNECVLVLSKTGAVSDFMLYSLGVRDSQELTDMVKQFMNGDEISAPTDIEPVSYDTILNTEYKLVNACDYYQYDSDYDVWVDKSDDTDYMKELISNGETIKIVGIVKPAEDAKVSMLTTGINYPYTLTTHIVEEAAQSQIVKDQLADSTKDVITGKTFDEEAESSNDFDMSSLITIDTSALSSAFNIDSSKLTVNIDTSSFDMESIMKSITIPEFDQSSIGDMSDSIKMDTTALPTAMTSIVGQYLAYCSTAGTLGDATAMTSGFPTWLATDQTAQLTLAAALGSSISVDDQAIATKISTAMASYMQDAMTSMVTQIGTAMASQMQTIMTKAMTQLSSSMASAMSIDESAFANAFQFNLDSDTLSSLMSSMSSTDTRSYSNNLKNFGYADLNAPYEIDIYPIDFESKEKVIDILDAYNDDMKAAGDDEKVISYTDIVGVLMSSVTDIVNMISMVLIAFVAISLIVSSIMIGVITYISVLERKKEIGILRAIGASKHDISHVFNAETIIEGLIAGVIGIAVTATGCAVANVILVQLDYPAVAQLPVNAGAILILISVLLTFVAGVIPASSASKKDPVEALRSE